MTDNRKVINHRCDGLLKDKKSIRYGQPYRIAPHPEDIGWWLFGTKYDSEYGECYHRPIINLKYCPYCGENMNAK